MNHSHFDAALVWALCRDSFEMNILHWHIAFTSLVDTGLVQYHAGLGYFLPHLYQPLEITLTSNHTDKEKLALLSCKVDSKHQLYLYYLHFINEMHRINCQCYGSIDSSLMYFDRHRYHFRQVIIAFMATSKAAVYTSSALNDRLTFALCGSLCNILTYRIDAPVAVELTYRILTIMQRIIAKGKQGSDGIGEQFVSVLDLEVIQERRPKEYQMYLHYIRAWYDGITQYLRQNNGVQKAIGLVQSMKDDQDNIDQLPAQERAKLLQLQGFLLEKRKSYFAALKCYEAALDIIKKKDESFRVKNKPNYVTMKNFIEYLRWTLEGSVKGSTDTLEAGCACVIS